MSTTYHRLVFMLFIVFVVLAGCRQQVTSSANTNIEIGLAFTQDPPVIGATTLFITVSDSSGNPIDDATLNVRGDMSHAGMLPVIREDVEDNTNGVYEVPFEWTMGGDWFVEVTVTRPNGESVLKRFDLAVLVPEAVPEQDGSESQPQATEETR